MVFVRSVLSPSSKDLNLVNLKWHLRTDHGDTDIGRGYSMKHGVGGGEVAFALHRKEPHISMVQFKVTKC